MEKKQQSKPSKESFIVPKDKVDPESHFNNKYLNKKLFSEESKQNANNYQTKL